MASPSLAHAAHETQPPEYVHRGRGLFETYADEILEGCRGGGLWLIPSGSTVNKVYEIRPGTRRKSARCECVGFYHHGHGSHLVASGEAKRRSSVCDNCGQRHWHSGLVEVNEEDGLLSQYPGDRLCRGCIREGHGHETRGKRRSAR